MAGSVFETFFWDLCYNASIRNPCLLSWMIVNCLGFAHRELSADSRISGTHMPSNTIFMAAELNTCVCLASLGTHYRSPELGKSNGQNLTLADPS